VTQSKSIQEDGWKPRWFKKDDKEDSYHYLGGYWEAKDQNNWYGCRDIFKDLSDEYANMT
jgi:oxysterol-binding protein 1